jgi:hypothetical protein
MARKSRKWIGGAIRHPGALKKAARRHGISTKEEAERESHSSNPKIRARGNLGKRFLGIARHGNIRRKKARKTVRKRA